MADLLTRPSKEDMAGERHVQVERLDWDCEMDIDRFQTLKTQLAAQYSDLYFVRLAALKPEVIAEAHRMWPGVNICDRILDAEPGVKSVLVGTIYKEMKLKPNVLAEYTEGNNYDFAGLNAKSFVSDSDYAVIEDESGRITLNLKGDKVPKVDELVTGVILGALGALDDEGHFLVEGVCYPGMGDQAQAKSSDAGAQILLVSGLELGGSEGDPLSADLLVDFVTGSLGGAGDHEEAAKIVKVIIAGNSCAWEKVDDDQGRGSSKNGANVQRIAEKERQSAVHPVRELDVLLTRLSASVPVDLMPGATDPSGVFLPQQPFHHCLLPSANTYSTFHTVTNPYEMKAGAPGSSITVVGTSGQNVSDVLKYTSIKSPLEVLQRMLEWRHMAPTAPDTLACFPLKDSDPFIMETCPRIFFAGNQPEFGHQIVEGPKGQRCLALSIPSFAKTGSAVLVNLVTLECHEVNCSVEKFAEAVGDDDVRME